jgi:hypothetical protein
MNTETLATNLMTSLYLSITNSLVLSHPPMISKMLVAEASFLSSSNNKLPLVNHLLRYL